VTDNGGFALAKQITQCATLTAERFSKQFSNVEIRNKSLVDVQ
jgi:hypothetical protein